MHWLRRSCGYDRVSNAMITIARANGWVSMDASASTITRDSAQCINKLVCTCQKCPIMCDFSSHNTNTEINDKNTVYNIVYRV